MATGTIQKPIRWISFTATSDVWGQIIIPANVVSPTQNVVAVRTIGCYALTPMLDNSQSYWVVTLVQNTGTLSPLANTLTVIYLGVA